MVGLQVGLASFSKVVRVRESKALVGKRAFQDTYDCKWAEPGAGPFRMTSLTHENVRDTLA